MLDSLRGRRRLFQPILLAVCLLGLAVALQEDQYRRRPELGQGMGLEAGVKGLSGGPTAALVAALGGFRYLAADLLWMESDEVWHSGDWWAMVPLLEAVTALDPNFVLAWRTLGWHQAWNLHAAETSPIAKRQRIEAGERAFEQGISFNPNDWEMRWELAWLYFDRTKEYHRAVKPIEETARLKDAPSWVHRALYRVYEKTLEIDKLKPALEKNLKLFSNDPTHQYLVKRDWDYWFVKGPRPQEVIRPAATDPQEHKRIILQTNRTRKNRGLEPYLYPGNPYWDVDPKTGMPVPKGSLKNRTLSAAR
jgi:tetratricopeptide (TPR) repeat protein